MPKLHRLSSAVRNLLRPGRGDHELDAEMRAHLELLAAEKTKQGMSPHAAQRAARIELGGVEQVKEEVRSVRSGVWLEQLFQDVRFGARQLRRNPGFSALAVFTLALAIGLNAAIFTVFYGLLLRPLPARDPEQLVRLYSGVQGEPDTNFLSYPEYLYCREKNSSLAEVAAYAGGRVLLTSLAGSAPEWLQVQVVSANFFSLLGAGTSAGRTFLPEEDQAPGAHPVAILSFGLWQSRFGADPAVIGKAITLNSMLYTVVGIAPRGFIGADPEVPDAWIPLAMSANVYSAPPMFDDRKSGWLSALARLKPGVSLVAAAAELELMAAQFHAADPATPRKPTLRVTAASFLTPSQQSDTIPFAALLLGAVALVLLIACANVANLQLAHGVARQKELGIRIALGGSRARLARQLLIESLLLNGLAGAAGLLLAWWGAGLMLALTDSLGSHGMSLEVTPDWRVVLYLAALSLLSGITSGLLPALRVSRQDPLHAMREESGAETWRRGSRLRSLLVISQMALSLFLLVAAGLFARALGKARAVELGFETRAVAALYPDLRLHGYDVTRSLDFDRRLVERLSGLPGVRSVALVRNAPLGKDFSQTSVLAEDRGSLAGRRVPKVDFNVVSPEVFATLGIPLVRGRGFTAAEIASSARVAVVNESLARALWPGEDALGKRLHQGHNSPLFEVVGVARDARTVYLWEGSLPYLYFPAIPELLDKYSDLAVLVRTNGDASLLAPALPPIVRQLDPAVTSSAHPLDENLDFWLWPSRMGALLSTILGLLALLLAAVGITSMTAYAVTQRTREIGVRMALGAAPAQVLGLLLRQTGRQVAIGGTIGLAAAAAVSRLLGQFLYGIKAGDGLAFAAGAALLGAAALAACYLPARRAARVDPVIALRHE